MLSSTQGKLTVINTKCSNTFKVGIYLKRAYKGGRTALGLYAHLSFLTISTRING
jgi:hypothetical protein